MEGARGESRPKVCRYFRTPGGCRYGAYCRFSHEGVSEVTENTAYPNRDICRYFNSSGGCRNGRGCRFSHTLVLKNEEEKDHSLTPPLKSEASPNTLDIDKPTSPESQLDEIKCERGESTPKAEEETGQQAKCVGNAKKQKKKRECNQWKTFSCGDCKQVFKGKDCLQDLADHHMDNLKKMEKSHLRFLKTSHEFRKFVVCDVCKRGFACSRDLLRHVVDKSKMQKLAQDEESHFHTLTQLADIFTDRDMGISAEDEVHEELVSCLTEGTFSSGESMPLSDEDFDEELLERMENCGFTNDEVEELLCQGVKPWDPEAYDVLSVLYNWDDYF